MLGVLASNHQCHPKFFGRGRQCVANSYAAMIYHSTTKKASEWTQKDLDKILLEGDDIYYNIKMGGQKEEYLLVTDLPYQWKNFEMKLVKSDSGSVSNLKQMPSKPYVSLDLTVREIENFMFLTIKCYTTAIIRENDVYYVFDPHSRNREGMVNADGKAVLTTHIGIENLIIFLEKFALSLGHNEKEVVAFEASHIEILNSDDTIESDDFEGFSEMSDGEFSCLMQIIEEEKDEKIKKIEEDLEQFGSANFNTTNSLNSSTTDLSEDDMPLATLSKLLKVDSSCSDSDYIYSSGSEFELLEDEKQMLSNSYSDSSDSSSSKRKKPMKRKLKKPRKVPSTKTSVAEKLYTVSGTEHSYCSKEKCTFNAKSKVIDFEDSDLIMEETIVTEHIGQESDADIGTVLDEVEEIQSKIKHNDRKSENELGIMLDQDLEVAQEVIIEMIEENDNVDGGECSNDNIGLNFAEDMVSGSACDSMEELVEDVSFFDNCESDFEKVNKLGQVRGRKRSKNTDNWKRNKAKRNYNRGKAYIDSEGITHKGKKLGKGCGLNCRFKCHSIFSEEIREELFHSFWQLGDVTRQRQMLLKYAAPQKKKTSKLVTNRKRENTFMWSLPLNGSTVRVCKTFFLHTFNINSQRVQTALSKSQNIIGTVDIDQRGTHSNRPNRTPQAKIDLVVSHIKSFPAVESHYCRKDSNKHYLSPDLSVAQMYRLYLEQCAKKNVSPVSLNVYRHIFNTHFNIAFQKPLKDQCDLCNAYKNAIEIDKVNMKENYDNHIKNKVLARENKEQDKKLAQENNDSTYLAACFDLEEVLMTPKAFESSLYYKRRLNTFNFSIYNLGSSEANCYLWNESISGRGSCEISSCIFDFLDEMSKKGKKKFVFYSDNCWAQNKNKQYVSMIWYAVQKFGIEFVEQKYLEKGHTQNENDSVHACIERASRPISVYTTAQWAAVIRTARRKKPYNVKEMDLPNFYDFKSIRNMLKNFQIDTERSPVYWPNIRSFRIEAANPNIVAIQYDYNGPVHYLDLVHKIRRSNSVLNAEDIVLNRLHKEYPKIHFEKYKDLISLCTSGVIPPSHHLFYAVLSHEIQSA